MYVTGNTKSFYLFKKQRKKKYYNFMLPDSLFFLTVTVDIIYFVSETAGYHSDEFEFFVICLNGWTVMHPFIGWIY